ncbi:O-acyltransferase WSD1 [Hibiscus syriacus]|uniref:O-acyltransferase WSD1 n=1 Tax=Hibiscus syriacus TaxID=106335 RepID=A0A6A3AAJ8_HIBSY|nr:O-acyltransferase WSD1 [Hibiscus syriacus]
MLIKVKSYGQQPTLATVQPVGCGSGYGVLFSDSTYEEGPSFAIDVKRGKFYGGIQLANGRFKIQNKATYNSSHGVGSLTVPTFFAGDIRRGSKISPETVSNLRLKWKFNAGRDITRHRRFSTEQFISQVGIKAVKSGNRTGFDRILAGQNSSGPKQIKIRLIQVQVDFIGSRLDRVTSLTDKFRSDVYRIRIKFRSGSGIIFYVQFGFKSGAGRVQIYNFQVQLGFSFAGGISFLQPSWDGYLYAVNESDGSLIWKQNLQQLTGFNSGGLISNISVIISRTTPAIADDLVIVGICGPASIVAVKRSSGELVWSTLLDGNPAGCITMSGTYYNGNFYVVTSSLEEVFSLDKCCTFRGSFVKLDAKTGKIMWQTFMLPDNFGNRGEYAGAAIWGSSPPSTPRELVYIATGNLYSFPQNISDCQERQNNQTQVPPTHSDECIESDNHSESFVALDMDTGNIKWFHQLGGYDVWFFACSNLSVPDCPPGPNPDADFGEAPMMLTIDVNGTEKDIVVAVQKSGFAWLWIVMMAIWFTEAGPGGVAGGGTWGAATDEKRVNVRKVPQHFIGRYLGYLIYVWISFMLNYPVHGSLKTCVTRKVESTYCLCGRKLIASSSSSSFFFQPLAQPSLQMAGATYTTASSESIATFGTSKLIGFATSKILSTNSVCPVRFVYKSLSVLDRHGLPQAEQTRLRTFSKLKTVYQTSLVNSGPYTVDDEEQFNTNIANSDRKNFTLKPSTRNATAGGWVAVDSNNGRILWSTGDPSNGTISGPVTVANEVLFGGSTYKEGPIYAMDGKTGEILWSYNTGATVFGGMSVSDGCVFVGHGYRVGFGTLNPNNTAGNTLFAFCIS